MDKKQEQRLVEVFEGAKIGPVTDEQLKESIPLFVEGSNNPKEDHKCGTCSMRVRFPDKAECTIVEGTIDLKKGTCALWNRGPAASPKDISQCRVPKESAIYEEADVINCSTCGAFDSGFCRTWEGKVGKGECCIVWHPKKGDEL